MIEAGVTNVVIAGLGGQGVVKASDILSQAAFAAGLDVKKSEIHGMSQRGGSVSSDVRFGERVFSPMIPRGQADFLIIMEETQVTPNIHHIRPGGVLITPDHIPYILEVEDEEQAILLQRTLNVAMIGVLSSYIPNIMSEHWLEAIHNNVPNGYFEINRKVFLLAQAVEQVMSRLVTTTSSIGGIPKPALR